MQPGGFTIRTFLDLLQKEKKKNSRTMMQRSIYRILSISATIIKIYTSLFFCFLSNLCQQLNVCMSETTELTVEGVFGLPLTDRRGDFHFTGDGGEIGPPDIDRRF